jgi:hypothetical protein
MRFVVINGSQTGHSCCFSATIVDTTKPTMIGELHFKNQFEPICECFKEEDAKQIAESLNWLEENDT